MRDFMGKVIDNQKPIFERLMLGPFPENLAKILYGKYNPCADQIYREGIYKVSEPKAIFVDGQWRGVQHDVILYMSRFGRRAGKQKVLDRDIISLEIKTTERDIWQSSVEKYLGATRQFFIAAPSKLLPAVIERYSHDSQKGKIGIVDTDNGQVVVLPQFQNYSKERANALLAHCYTSSHRYSSYNDTEPYELRRVIPRDESQTSFIYYNGLNVNREYIDMFFHYGQ